MFKRGVDFSVISESMCTYLHKAQWSKEGCEKVGDYKRMLEVFAANTYVTPSSKSLEQRSSEPKPKPNSLMVWAGLLVALLTSAKCLLKVSCPTF